MAQGLYLPGDSFFHRLRPPVKLAAILLSFVPPLLLLDPRALAALAALLALLVLSCGAGRALWKVRALAVLLVATSLVLWPLFRPSGETLRAIGPVAITRGGVLYGLAVALRLLCFLLATLLLVSTTKAEEFSFALTRLGAPFRVAFALSLAFRLVPLFMDTGRTIVAAQRARGLDLDAGGVIPRARKHVPILVPILLSSVRKADRMAVALEARGFSAPGRRTSLADCDATWRDAVAVAVVLAVLAASVATRWPALIGR